MKRIVENLQTRHFLGAMLMAGIVLTAVSGSGEPLFSDLDGHVIVANNTVHLADDVQVSSGNLASNDNIRISEENIINGSLFAPTIQVASGTTVNGNATFDKLILADMAEILGTTSTPIQEPVIELPEVPDFQPGTEDLVVDQDTTINPQSLDRLTIEKDTTLTLNPGTYNLASLTLKDRAKLVSKQGTTTINIKQSFRANDEVLISPLNPAQDPTSLRINFTGEGPGGSSASIFGQARGFVQNLFGGGGNQHQGPSDNKPPENKPPDNQPPSDPSPKNRGGQPIAVGENSFVTARILASHSKVILGDQNTFRGQLFARDVQVGEGGVLSRSSTGIRLPRVEDIIQDPGGGVYPVNELLVSLGPATTFIDAKEVAEEFNGRIVGVVQSINLYQMVFQTSTVTDIENLMSDIRQESYLSVDGVFRNFVQPIEL